MTDPDIGTMTENAARGVLFTAIGETMRRSGETFDEVVKLIVSAGLWSEGRVREILFARIDTDPPTLRDLAGIAAVLGFSIEFRLVERTAEQDPTP